MIVDDLAMSAADFAVATGWEIKPEGACRADVCVPLAPGEFDFADTASRLGMAVVADEARGRWAIGPESLGARALATAQAPELVLGDLAGTEFSLSSLRGQKVVLVSWAPY
jgi:hypothetical protein